jgi:4,5-DOPA dioxygenase extradiol
VADRRLPSVFVSHGAPSLILGDSPARRFLEGLGASLGRPRAVLCVSAHWETAQPAASAAAAPATIHDFFGFPESLYRLDYPAPGAPELAMRAAALLKESGFACDVDRGRGLDHGAWAPLMLMYPAAEVPVAQLSVQPVLGPPQHVALGRALAPLGEAGVLVLGSGGAVHNLRHFRPGSGEVPEWARRFEDWLVDRVTAGDAAAVAAYRTESRDGALAHPRDEHFLPLCVAFGAGGAGAKGRVLHRGFMDGGLGMAAFAFAGEMP